MEIRLATLKDFTAIKNFLEIKNISYISPAHAYEDIKNNALYIIEKEGQVIAQCSLVEEKSFEYVAIKRLVSYGKEKGIAQTFIEYFKSFGIENLGCTPWTNNARMRAILEKNGFTHQYTFLNCYEFYLLTEKK